MKNNCGRLMAALLAAWLVFALVASARHWFRSDSNQIGLAVGLAALAPVAVFGLWFAFSNRFRQFALGLDPRALTFVQSLRAGGFTFVVLQAYGILPAVFALPAGYGDIAIGATASLAALMLAKPEHRNGFLVWQTLGIADLVMAVSLGTTAILLSPHGPSTAPMTVLPLSLIPTFIVPLMVIFHIICIAQARTWKTASGDGRQTLGPVRNLALNSR